ncbi:ribosomal L7Ae/L30e/S12e/Gadd45 family protein [Candidatus Woesearchaeota archaeon]|nr:ribosomal L7Ae/L30e/S12e/Gadd45 family protein [Candidatus Woesearchaeota archaeon]
MAKAITSTEIKKLLKAKSLVIGTEKTLKSLKLGKIEKVILSSNCPDKVAENMGYYAGLSNVETVKVPYPNEELGVICKKPFSISVLSILKGAK